MRFTWAVVVVNWELTGGLIMGFGQSLVPATTVVVATVEGVVEMDQLLGPVDNSILYVQEGHRSQLVYSGQETKFLKCWEHHRSLGGWLVDPCIILIDEGMPDAQSTVAVDCYFARAVDRSCCLRCDHPVKSSRPLLRADVGIAKADFADSKVAIRNADSEAGIAYADSMLASSLPVAKLPTWQLGDYFGN
ncbi:hypothetical protein Taro_048448 [Colocasia esculenta]|uniref:Uncharacterized protein n=1 Tax=Colocasia esculenta TaxID=4460 RepID=A0A843WVV6_COLES|nr:hypothetical protein [Colocasia esculenta]